LTTACRKHFYRRWSIPTACRNGGHIKAAHRPPKFSKSEGALEVRIHAGRLLKFSVEHPDPSPVVLRRASVARRRSRRGKLARSPRKRTGSGRGRHRACDRCSPPAMRLEAAERPSSRAGLRLRLRLHAGKPRGLRAAASGECRGSSTEAAAACLLRLVERARGRGRGRWAAYLAGPAHRRPVFLFFLFFIFLI